MGSKLFPSKIGKTTILNSQSIRMLQTHVNNDILNKYCLIHNNMQYKESLPFGKFFQLNPPVYP